MRHVRKIVALLPMLTAATAALLAVLPGGTAAAAAGAPADQAYAPASRVLRSGDTGRDVRRLQQRLAQLEYYPGKINGRFGAATLEAVWAFQEVQGLPVSGRVYRGTERALAFPRRPRTLVRRGAANRVEINLARHVLIVWRARRIVLISHISSGGGYYYCGAYSCGYAITPAGNFRAIRRIHGWHRSDLGLMYNPVYFHRGFAIHGDSYVPVDPVSHGCVRVPMDVARVFPSLVPNGTRIYVRG